MNFEPNPLEETQKLYAIPEITYYYRHSILQLIISYFTS